MQTYGNERNDADKAPADKPLFDETTLHYNRLLQGMNKVIQERTAELITSRAEMADLQARFKSREQAKDDATHRAHCGIRQTGRAGQVYYPAMSPRNSRLLRTKPRNL